MQQGQQSTSIVICAYSTDRWYELDAAVRSCLTQTTRPDQVIVVVDHNEELRRRAVRDLIGVTVLSNTSASGLSGARNTGVAAATADTVVFLDDDAYADPTWLEHLTAPLHDPAVAGVGGWIEPHFEVRPKEWFPEEFNWVVGCSYPDLPPTGGELRNPIGANMALRREVFSSVGGFRSDLGRVGKVPLGCEETELCIRYAATHPTRRMVMVREALVHHRVPASRLSWRYFLARCWAEGLSKATVASLVGSSAGLSSERRYAWRTLPCAIFRRVRRLPHTPRRSLVQIGAIVAGTLTAAAGWVRGKVSASTQQ